MSTTTTTAVTATTEHELQEYSHSSATETNDRHLQTEQLDALNTGAAQDSDNVISAIPDGGYGWLIVLSCSIRTYLNRRWKKS